MASPRAPLSIEAAAALLRRGGLVAYPTEAVFGLGCNPRDGSAVRRLLALKRREEAKGVILIAADEAQLVAYLDVDALPADRLAAVRASWPGPHTWLMPCRDDVPRWIRGAHDTLAVRVTAHPVAAALCRAFGAPLVSTSANLAGEPPARSVQALDAPLLAGIDGVVAGEVSGLAQPTPIRDARTGASIRA